LPLAYSRNRAASDSGTSTLRTAFGVFGACRHAPQSLDRVDRTRCQARGLTAKRRYLPQFAFNDEQLRRVLAAYIFRYAKMRLPEIEELEALLAGGIDALKELSAERERTLAELTERDHHGRFRSAKQRKIFSEHRRLCRERGGRAAFVTRLCWLYYRCEGNSVSVAEELSCSPVAVRQVASRLCSIARELGFPTFPPHRTAGRRRIRGHFSCSPSSPAEGKVSE